MGRSYQRPGIPLHALMATPLSIRAHRLFTTLGRYQTVQSHATVVPRGLPHLTQQSTVHQISVSDKAVTFRRAAAMGHVVFSNSEPYRLIQQHALKKGDVLAVARVAAIMAVKKTGDFIPLAHGGVGVEGCVVDVEVVGPRRKAQDEKAENATEVRPNAGADSALGVGHPVDDVAGYLSTEIGSHGGIRIAVSVSTTAKTGIEMEALTGVVGAGLTVIDMCKAVDRHLKLEGVEVVGKSGGKSGAWGICSEKNR